MGDTESGVDDVGQKTDDLSHVENVGNSFDPFVHNSRHLGCAENPSTLVAPLSMLNNMEVSLGSEPGYNDTDADAAEVSTSWSTTPHAGIHNKSISDDEDANEDEDEEEVWLLATLRDLYRFKENTNLQVAFAIFLLLFQGFCILLAISTIEVEKPDIRMQFVGLPISLVMMFGTSWDDFQLEVGLMLFNIKVMQEKKSAKRDQPSGLMSRMFNFYALRAGMAWAEAFLVLLTIAASVLVTIQRRTVLDLALNCTALSLISQLDECVLKMFPIHAIIVKPKVKVEVMETRAEDQFNRIGAYKFRLFVTVFYCTVYVLFALFNNSYYYTQKYPWERGGWTL